MYIKYSTLALTLFQVANLVSAATNTTTTTTTKKTTSTNKLAKPQDYYKSFKTSIDPLNIVIPEITQTTSLDPAQQCAWYTPDNFKYNPKEWPNLWETATSNGMNATAEFKALYNSIDWTKAPKISVRKKGADGSLDMTGYDQVNDPDCWWSASTCVTPKHENVNPDISTCAEPETWGLTYDDGPNCSHNAFYDYLEEQKLKASMFYVGSNVVNWPYGAQRGQKAGHHLADHTWSHQLMTTLTNTEVLAELFYTQKAIKVVTGVTPLHWRPAFGDVDDRVRWIATQLNLTTVLWDLDTDDWAAGETKPVETVKQAYEEFIAKGQDGTYAGKGQITLTHEIDNMTMSLALEYLPKIQSAYKHVVDVATCMNITQPYQERQVKFATFEEYISGVSATNTSSTKASSPDAAKSATTTAAAIVAENATSAGYQLTPNTLALAVFAVALAFF